MEERAFENKVAVVTGGAHGIGLCIAEEFRRQGAEVEVIDIREGEHYIGDLSKKETLEPFPPTSSKNTVMWTTLSTMPCPSCEGSTLAPTRSFSTPLR